MLIVVFNIDLQCFCYLRIIYVTLEWQCCLGWRWHHGRRLWSLDRRLKVSSIRYQVSSIKYQVSDIRYQELMIQYALKSFIRQGFQKHLTPAKLFRNIPSQASSGPYKGKKSILRIWTLCHLFGCDASKDTAIEFASIQKIEKPNRPSLLSRLGTWCVSVEELLLAQTI